MAERTRERRERGSISAHEIVSGAMQLIRADGVDALSMPRLAQQLGIGVTSIYWYFKSKEVLMAALTAEAARLYGERLPHEPHSTWWEALRDHFLKIHVILKTDDLLCDLLYLRSAPLGAEALSYIWPQLEHDLGLMVEAGFSLEEAIANHFAISHYVRGCATLDRQMRKADMAPAVPVRLPAAFDRSRFPILTDIARWHSLRGTTDLEFEAGLDAIIEGLRARLESRTS